MATSSPPSPRSTFQSPPPPRSRPLALRFSSSPPSPPGNAPELATASAPSFPRSLTSYDHLLRALALPPPERAPSPVLPGAPVLDINIIPPTPALLPDGEGLLPAFDPFSAPPAAVPDPAPRRRSRTKSRTLSLDGALDLPSPPVLSPTSTNTSGSSFASPAFSTPGTPPDTAPARSLPFSPRRRNSAGETPSPPMSIDALALGKDARLAKRVTGAGTGVKDAESRAAWARVMGWRV